MSYTYTMTEGTREAKEAELSPAAKQVLQAVDNVPDGARWAEVAYFIEKQPNFPWLEQWGFRPETVKQMIADDPGLRRVFRDLQTFLFLQERAGTPGDFKIVVRSLPELFNMVAGPDAAVDDFWQALHELKRARRFAATAKMVKANMESTTKPQAELPEATGLDKAISSAIRDRGGVE